MSKLQNDWERVARYQPLNRALIEIDYNDKVEKYRITATKGGKNISKQFNADRRYDPIMGMSRTDSMTAADLSNSLEQKLDIILP